jgi:hypothetical protein
MTKCLLAMILAAAVSTASAQNKIYSSTDVSGARFGGTIGAGTDYRYASANANVDFGGRAALSCSGIDFNTFLNTFKPQELLSELTGSIRSGAQAAATNYVIALAYANPTIAAVLDMMDQRFSARFNAFAEQCNAAMARARGESEGARQMAAGLDQCFSQKVQNGESPTQAYRDCAKSATVASMNLPATASLKDFLTRYSQVNVTRELESMLGLLPDTKTTTDGVQVKPATLTITKAKGNVGDWTGNAADAILAGIDPNAIPDCPPEVISTPITSANDRCIPVSAGVLVRSPAFLSARLLSTPEQKMYVDALSEQVAAAEIRARIVQLRQEISQLAPKPMTDASAEDVSGRREAMLRELDRLDGDARALEALTAAKAQVARTQILAMQRVSGRLASAQATAARATLADNNAFVGGMRTLFGLKP